jgi:hypothetical protein
VAPPGGPTRREEPSRSQDLIAVPEFGMLAMSNGANPYEAAFEAYVHSLFMITA